MSGGVTIRINLSDIVYNADIIKKYCRGAKVCAMVKDNAYGHGLNAVVKSIKHICGCYGTARLDEAVKVRKAAGGGAEVLVCSDINPDVKKAAKYDISLTAFSHRELSRIINEAKAAGVTVKIHIKTDSGMNRLGVKSKTEFYDMLNACGCSHVELKGIYTHFAHCADREFTRTQFKAFKQYVENAKELFPHITAHCASSAAIFSDTDYHMDMVRAGINLYGYEAQYAQAKGIILRPAMQVTSHVIDVKTAKKGESIGYMRAYKADGETLYAIVAAGYGDGYKRGLSAKASVSINGKVYPVIGNVCMNSFFVKLDKNDSVKPNDEVILFDGNTDGRLSFEHNAKILNTIVYELLTSFNATAARKYIH